MPAATVEGSDDVEVCRDADVLVLTVAPGAVVLIVTNPVDVITYAALKILGLPRHRVLGSGTVLDSARLRSLIAQHCGVAVLYDEHHVLPVSSLLTGYAGISDVCLSVPSVVSRAGVPRVLPVPLSGAERDGLHRSAQAIRAVIDKLEL